MTPYRPQANGMVERNNYTLEVELRARLLNIDLLEWDRLLPHAMRTMRTMHATPPPPPPLHH